MRIAVEGCAHGDLDNIYATLKHAEESENMKIEILLCCGDFQAVRNEGDLESLACPPKYRAMNSFWKYFNGEKVAPYLTIFIGGNHEASNYLWELYFGGWVAPNIYFLGFSGIIKFGGLRIGGISGIFNHQHYHMGHFERPPYSPSSLRSVYHIREYMVRKLMMTNGTLDVLLSHDWPRGITAFGDEEVLLRKKPFFRDEIRQNTLGSPPGMQLLKKLKPSYWFSAHLHVKFAAVFPHVSSSSENNGNLMERGQIDREKVQNDGKMGDTVEEIGRKSGETSKADGGKITKFLALDKCLRGKPFLQILEIVPENPEPLELRYDEEWLAITRAFHGCFPLGRNPPTYSNEEIRIPEELEWVKRRLSERGSKVPLNFVQTAPSFDPTSKTKLENGAILQRNPQTVQFLELLDLKFPFEDQIPIPISFGENIEENATKRQKESDPNEIDLSDGSE